MARQCTVCAHPAVKKINSELIAGTTYRKLAQEYELSQDAIGRHKRNHLATTLAASKKGERLAESASLVEQIEKLRDEAERLARKAEEAGDIRTALSGVREMLRILELLSKLAGDLDERPQVNIYVTPEYQELRTEMMTALGPYPAARVAVASRLVGLENGHASGD